MKTFFLIIALAANAQAMRASTAIISASRGCLTNLGEVSGNPGFSCGAIYNDCKSRLDGLYYINAGGSTEQTYCDMTNGGWTLFANMTGAGTPGANTAGAYNAPPTPAVNATRKITHAAIDAIRLASSYNSPIKLDFYEVPLLRYVSKECSWITPNLTRNRCASWTSSPDSLTYVTRCGTGDVPLLNNGGGGEWASGTVSWPYQDGTCSHNGGFGYLNPDDAWYNWADWVSYTGLSGEQKYKLRIWVK